jgi:acid stress chaperone HdeB
MPTQDQSLRDQSKRLMLQRLTSKHYKQLPRRKPMLDLLSEKMLTILKFVPALAVAVALMAGLETVPAARAQVTIDASKITCDQYIGYKVTNPQNIAIWLSGYYHGKRGETTVDTQQLAEYTKKVRDYCLRNPKTLVMQAVETLIEQKR